MDFGLAQPMLRCDDCDALLKVIDDSAMDVDFEVQDHHCRGCGRTVCGTCSVVADREERECLQCKTSPRKWVGGIGWIQLNLV